MSDGGSAVWYLQQAYMSAAGRRRDVADMLKLRDQTDSVSVGSASRAIRCGRSPVLLQPNLRPIAQPERESCQSKNREIPAVVGQLRPLLR